MLLLWWRTFSNSLSCICYIQKRLEKAKALKLCFNCLNTGHLTVRLTNSRVEKCEGPHNTAICNKIATKSAEIASITTGSLAYFQYAYFQYAPPTPSPQHKSLPLFPLLVLFFFINKIYIYPFFDKKQSQVFDIKL